MPSNRDSPHLTANPSVPHPCFAPIGCYSEGEPYYLAIPNQNLSLVWAFCGVDKPLSEPACHVCNVYAAGLVLADLDCAETNRNAGRHGEVRESGLTGVTRNHVCPCWHRGFESPPLRQCLLFSYVRYGSFAFVSQA